MKKIAICPSRVRSLYVDECLTVEATATALGCSPATVARALAALNVPRRPRQGVVSEGCADCAKPFAVYRSHVGFIVRCLDCRGSNRWGSGPPRKTVRPCATCYMPLEVPSLRASKTTRSFCSRACQGAFQKTISGANHPQWAGGYKAKAARVEADPQKRLRRRFSNQVWWALKGKKSFRKWELLVGYSVSDLRFHLERQFTGGMTWDNYGQWHIDHVVPVSSFQFTSAEEPAFRACFSLSNLRPLWAVDNLSKGAKRLNLL